MGRYWLRNLLEKYLKKLIGKTDIEDALKRLDKLTNEEVRMVTAQVLRATHDGAQPSLITHQGNMFNLMYLEGKKTRVAIQQVADDMDQMKR